MRQTPGGPQPTRERMIRSWVPAFIALLLTNPAHAELIQLRQTLTSTLEPDRLRLHLSVHNFGREAALKIQPIVWFLGRSHPLPPLERLESGHYYQQRLDLIPPGEGHYGLLVDLRYHSPRAAYSLPAFIANPEYRPPEELRLAWEKNGDTPRLRLENRTREPLGLTLTVLAPWELGLIAPPPQLTLAPDEQRRFDIPLSYLDIAAHHGNTTLHALADFDTPEGHRIAHAALELNAAPALAAVPWNAIALAAGLLLVTLILLGLRRQHTQR